MTVSRDELFTVFWGLVVLLSVQVLFGQLRWARLNYLHLQRRMQHFISGLVVIYIQRTFSVDVTRLFLVSATIFTVIAHKTRQYNPIVQRIFVSSFHSILRKPEALAYQTPGALHYLLGNLIAVSLYSPNFCSLVLLALGFGDPMAGILGTLFPSRRIYGTKTLSGFLGCATVSGPVLMAAHVFWTEREYSSFQSLLIMTLFGIATAVAELFVIIDDNISIPVFFGLIFRFAVYVSSNATFGPTLYEIYTI